MAVPSPTGVGDYDHDKVPGRLVQFRKQDMVTALGGVTGNITITGHPDSVSEDLVYS